MAQEDKGVPIEEIFSRAERRHLGFIRWWFAGHPEEGPDAEGKQMWRRRPHPRSEQAKGIQPGPGGRGTI